MNSNEEYNKKKNRKPVTFGEHRDKICERCKTEWPGGLYCKFCGGRLVIASED